MSAMTKKRMAREISALTDAELDVLIMIATSKKQLLNDPEVIRCFAEEIKVLTVAGLIYSTTSGNTYTHQPTGDFIRTAIRQANFPEDAQQEIDRIRYALNKQVSTIRAVSTDYGDIQLDTDEAEGFGAYLQQNLERKLDRTLVLFAIKNGAPS